MYCWISWYGAFLTLLDKIDQHIISKSICNKQIPTKFISKRKCKANTKILKVQQWHSAIGLHLIQNYDCTNNPDNWRATRWSYPSGNLPRHFGLPLWLKSRNCTNMMRLRDLGAGMATSLIQTVIHWCTAGIVAKLCWNIVIVAIKIRTLTLWEKAHAC